MMTPAELASTRPARPKRLDSSGQALAYELGLQFPGDRRNLHAIVQAAGALRINGWSKPVRDYAGPFAAFVLGVADGGKEVIA
jgi:hypothetical protein